MFKFLGIGCQKAATTWLSKCLSEHPSIYIPKKKELHFFDNDKTYQKGIDYYNSFFDGKTDKVCGEVTPAYIYFDYAAERIHHHFPSVQFLLILRDPAYRAVSQYKMEVRRGAVRCHFLKAFNEDILGMKSRGLYLEQINRYLRFFDKSTIKIFLYDDVIQTPHKVIHDSYKHIGVNSDFEPTSLNTVVKPEGTIIKESKVRVIIKPDEIEKIRDYYMPYTFALESFLNRDLIKWRE